MVEAAAPPPEGGGQHGEEVSRRLRALHHDLSQPLAAIGAYAEAVLGDPDLPERAIENLERLAEEVAALLELCRHALVQRVPPCPVSLGHLARAVAAGCQTIHDADIGVQVSRVALVVGEEVELRRMLWNLLDNACRAAGVGGRVRVTVDGAGGLATLEVGDSGPGFGQAGEGKASLGLAGVGLYVRTQGGDLRVSTSELGGALVTVTLPAGAVAMLPPALDGG